jgi:hypothetical protein
MKIAILPILVLPLSAVSADNNKDMSLTFHNLSEEQQLVSVNFVEYELDSNKSLRLPCRMGEAYTVQVNEISSVERCGSVVEVY